MSRGRVVTPEFWTDGNMIGCTPLARLFYLGMWNFAYCDKGHLPDDPMGLKLRILPADQVDPNVLLDELIGCKRVVRLEADDETFLFMPKFERHQKSDPRWKTRCPACALQDSLRLSETQASFSEHAETLPTSALREEKRTRENRRELERTPAPSARDSELEDIAELAYASWPKKVNRTQAIQRFIAASKGGFPSDLLETVRKYAAAYATTTEKQFIPALGVWLKAERWTDELPTGPQRKRAKEDEFFDVLRMGQELMTLEVEA